LRGETKVEVVDLVAGEFRASLRKRPTKKRNRRNIENRREEEEEQNREKIRCVCTCDSWSWAKRWSWAERTSDSLGCCWASWAERMS
jgi:hypothetical protein